MKNYKVRCKDLEESHIIQKYAFGLGYKWYSSDSRILRTHDFFYLFFKENGEIRYTNNITHFNGDSSIEITPQEFVTLKEIGGEINMRDKFEEGELVEVSDDRGEWCKRIFLAKVDSLQFPYLCVYATTESEYKYGEDVCVNTWKYCRKISSTPKIELEIKINGKEAKLSDISEETLLNLRNQN
jgi:hypothetical protein